MRRLRVIVFFKLLRLLVERVNHFVKVGENSQGVFKSFLNKETSKPAYPSLLTFASISSKTMRHPRPWSRVPSIFLSSIISDNFACTTRSSNPICWAIKSICTSEYGRIILHRLSSSKLLYKRSTWLFTIVSYKISVKSKIVKTINHSNYPCHMLPCTSRRAEDFVLLRLLQPHAWLPTPHPST